MQPTYNQDSNAIYGDSNSGTPSHNHHNARMFNMNWSLTSQFIKAEMQDSDGMIETISH